MGHIHHHKNWQKFGKWIVGGIFIGIGFAFLFGWAVMLLWNWLMPAIFGLSAITYWQAWGLLLLCHILFKAGGSHPHHDKNHPGPAMWKEKVKEKMKDKFCPDCEERSTGDGSTESQDF